jgi:hypothetical protein
MRIELREIRLTEGVFEAELQFFEENDRQTLSEIYSAWRSLCGNLRALKSRAVNLPEGLSEGAFALEMKAPRLIKCYGSANTSFDCYDLKNNERVQVKACSVLPDLTSFGPKSVWDKIYFCDFYRKGLWDGTFDIYLIHNKLIYNHKVNRFQTFIDQQKEGRRPRFSIYSDIIIPNNMKPVKTGSL